MKPKNDHADIFIAMCMDCKNESCMNGKQNIKKEKCKMINGRAYRLDKSYKKAKCRTITNEVE